MKERRSALGWSREELARRCGIDKRALQLIELGEWTEEDALRRVDLVLDMAEKGEFLTLPAQERPEPGGEN